MKSNFFQHIRYFLLLIILWFVSLFAINFYVVDFWKKFILEPQNIKNYKIWLVLWAGIKKNSIPTDILKDRLQIAYNYYKKWKIKKIIVSGDNAKNYHNEPEVMKKYLINLWVKNQDIYPDYAWFDTYDSIYRAKEIFDAKEIIIFTQKYHLYRSLYIANKLWLKAIWVETDLHKYLWYTRFKLRELLSRIKAFLEIEIFKSKPKFLGDKIEIK